MRTAFVACCAMVLAGCYVSAPVGPPLIPPAPPYGVTAYSGSDYLGVYIDVFWIRPYDPNIEWYNVYSAPTYGGPYSFVGSTRYDSFRDYRVYVGVRYYYAVTSVDYYGYESAYSTDVASAIVRPFGAGGPGGGSLVPERNSAPLPGLPARGTGSHGTGMRTQ